MWTGKLYFQTKWKHNTMKSDKIKYHIWNGHLNKNESIHKLHIQSIWVFLTNLNLRGKSILLILFCNKSIIHFLSFFDVFIKYKVKKSFYQEQREIKQENVFLLKKNIWNVFKNTRQKAVYLVWSTDFKWLSWIYLLCTQSETKWDILVTFFFEFLYFISDILFK